LQFNVFNTNQHGLTNCFLLLPFQHKFDYQLLISSSDKCPAADYHVTAFAMGLCLNIDRVAASVNTKNTDHPWIIQNQ